MRQTKKKKIFAAFIILIFIAAGLPLIHKTLTQGAEKKQVSAQLYIGKTKITKKTYSLEVGTSKKLKVKSSSELQTRTLYSHFPLLSVIVFFYLQLIRKQETKKRHSPQTIPFLKIFLILFYKYRPQGSLFVSI